MSSTTSRSSAAAENANLLGQQTRVNDSGVGFNHSHGPSALDEEEKTGPPATVTAADEDQLTNKKDF